MENSPIKIKENFEFPYIISRITSSLSTRNERSLKRILFQTRDGCDSSGKT